MGSFRLLLSEYSIGNLVTSILLLVITGYLLLLKEKKIETWLIVGYITALALLLLSYVVRYSVVDRRAVATGQVSNLIVFGVLCLVMFAYWYHADIFPIERRIISALFAAAALAIWISNFIRQPTLHWTFDFEAHYYTYEYGPRISYLTAVGYLWAAVVLFRKTVHFSRSAVAGRARNWIVEMAAPRGTAATSCRSFAFLVLLTMGMALLYGATQVGAVSRRTYSAVFSTGSLFVCLMIYVVYVGNGPRVSSFRERIVGITLSAVLVALGIANNVLVERIDANLERDYRADAALTARLVQDGNMDAIPNAVGYAAESGNPPTAIYVRKDLRAPLKERTITSYVRFAGFDAGDAIPEGKVSDGRYWFADIARPSTFYFEYDVTLNGKTYEIGYSYLEYRVLIHSFESGLAWIVFIAALFLAVSFPLLFNTTLVRPLKLIVEGIDRMKVRRYDTVIPVRSQDEMGLIAGSFNEFARSLREAESNFRALAENANDGILILNAAGQIRYANRRIADLTGHPNEELSKMRLRELVPTDNLSGLSANLQRRIEGEMAPGAYETTVINRSGDLIPVEVTGAHTTWETESSDVVVVRDIRERKDAESRDRQLHEQLMEADKLASLGILVAGVAHEVNSPNHAIRMNASFVLDALARLLPVVDRCLLDDAEELGPNSPLADLRQRIPDALVGIERSTEQVASVVQELKNYARRESERPPEKLQLNDVVKSVVSMSRKYIEKHTRSFSLELQHDLPLVRGHFQRLQQVVFNLIQNACQSLERTESRIILKSNASTDARSVCFVVKDEGFGISPENIARLTEPFFTTRSASGGTGLGLSITADIIRGHNGSIDFTSSPGEGTTVTVCIPRCEEP